MYVIANRDRYFFKVVDVLGEQAAIDSGLAAAKRFATREAAEEFQESWAGAGVGMEDYDVIIDLSGSGNSVLTPRLPGQALRRLIRLSRNS